MRSSYYSSSDVAMIGGVAIAVLAVIAIYLLLMLVFSIVAICKRSKGFGITGIIMSSLEIISTLVIHFSHISRAVYQAFGSVGMNVGTIIFIVALLLGFIPMLLSILGVALKKKAPKAPKAPKSAAPAQPVYQQPAAPVQPVYQQPAAPVQPVYQQPAAPVQPVYQQPVVPQPALNLSPEKAAELAKLDDLLANHVITKEEYEATKKWILS